MPDSSSRPRRAGADAEQRHQRLLAHALETGLALPLPPHSGSASDPATDNPTDLFLLLSPVVSDGETLAVVEILQRPSDLPTAPEGYLRFLSAVCELAADYHRRRQFGELRRRASSWSTFEEFTQSVHASLERPARGVFNRQRWPTLDRLRPRQRRTCATAGRPGWQAYRAWTLWIAGRPACGGSKQLIDAAIKIDEPILYPEDAAQLRRKSSRPCKPISICRMRGGWRSSRCTLLALLPRAMLHGRSSGHSLSSISHRPKEPQPPDHRSTPSPGRAQIALANALEYESVPLVRLWRAVGMSRRCVRGVSCPRPCWPRPRLRPRLPRSFLCPSISPSRGAESCCPSVVSEIFAPSDGVIADVRVAHGDQVEKGQPLVVLRRPQLDFERTRITGEVANGPQAARGAASIAIQPGRGLGRSARSVSPAHG